MPEVIQNYSGRTFRVGEFQAIAPENKLNISTGHNNLNEAGFTASIDKSGKVNLVVSNSNQNSVSIGYVRHDGSFSDCQNDSQIKSNGGKNKLISVNQNGAYSAQVSHNGDGTSTVSVIPHSSLSAVKIKLGNQVYFLKLSDLISNRDQALKAAEDARRAAAAKAADEAAKARQAEEIKRQAEALKKNSDAKEGSKVATEADKKGTGVPPISNNSPAPQTLLTTSALKMPDIKGNQYAQSQKEKGERELHSLIPAAIQASVNTQITRNNSAIKKATASPVTVTNSTSTNTIPIEIENASNSIKKPTPLTAGDARDQLLEMREAQSKLNKVVKAESGKLAKQMRGLGVDSPEYLKLEAELKSNTKLMCDYVLKQKALAEQMVSSSEPKLSRIGKNILVELRKVVPAAFDKLSELDPVNKASYATRKTTFGSDLDKLYTDADVSRFSKAAAAVEKFSATASSKAPFLDKIKTFATTPITLSRDGSEKLYTRVDKINLLTDQELAKESTLKSLSKLDKSLGVIEAKLRIEEAKEPGKLASKLDKIQNNRSKLALNVKRLLENEIQELEASPSTNQSKLTELRKSLYEEWGKKINDAQVKLAIPQAEIDSFKQNLDAHSLDKGLKIKFKDVPSVENARVKLLEAESRRESASSTPEEKTYLQESKKLAKIKYEIEKIQHEIRDVNTDPKKLEVLKRDLDTKIASEKLLYKSNIEAINKYIAAGPSTIPEVDRLRIELDKLEADGYARDIKSGKAAVKGMNNSANAEYKSAKANLERSYEKSKEASEKLEKSNTAKSNPKIILDNEQRLLRRQLISLGREAELSKLLMERYEMGIKTLDKNPTLTDTQKLQRAQLIEALELQKQVKDFLSQKESVLKGRVEVNKQKININDLDEKLSASPNDKNLQQQKTNAQNALAAEEAKLGEKVEVLKAKVKADLNTAKQKFLSKNTSSVLKATGIAAASEAIFASLKSDYSEDASHSALPTIIALLDRGTLNLNLEERTQFTTKDGGVYLAGLADSTQAFGDVAIGGVLAAGAIQGVSVAHYYTTAKIPYFGKATSFLGRTATGPIGGALLTGYYGYSTFADGNIGNMSNAQMVGNTSSPIAMGAVGGAFIAGPLGAAVGGGIGAVGEGIGTVRGLYVLEGQLASNNKMREIRNSIDRGLSGFVLPDSELDKYSSGDNSVSNYSQEEKDVVKNFSQRQLLKLIFETYSDSELSKLNLIRSNEENKSAVDTHNWEVIASLTDRSRDESWNPLDHMFSNALDKVKLSDPALYTKFGSSWSEANKFIDEVYKRSMRVEFSDQPKKDASWTIYGEGLYNAYGTGYGLWGNQSGMARVMTGAANVQSDFRDYISSLKSRGAFNTITESMRIDQVRAELMQYFPKLDSILDNETAFKEFLTAFQGVNLADASNIIPAEDTVIGRALLRMKDLSKSDEAYSKAGDAAIEAL